MDLKKFLEHLSLVCLLCLAAILYMGKSYDRSLQAMDSSVHARLALDVTRHFPPHLPISPASEGGHWEKGFNDHPFPFFWVNGQIMRALGPDAFSARLLPTLLSVVCVWLTFLIARLVTGSFGAGLGAGIVLALTPQFIGYGSRFHLDTPMIAGILASFYYWLRWKPLPAGLFAGLAVAVKGPVGLLLYPSIAVSMFAQDSVRKKRLVQAFQAFGVTLAVMAGVAVLTAHFGSWELVKDYWVRQVFGTAVEARGSGATPNLKLWLAITLKYALWILPLGVAIGVLVRARLWRQEKVLLTFAAAGIVFAVISCVRHKYEHYYLPMYPFLALLIAYGLREFFERYTNRIQWGLAALVPVVATACVVFPVSFGREKFPQLRFFNAIINSQSACHGSVLFIAGGQPYGGIGDYRAEVAFYTDRTVIESDCERAPNAIATHSVHWIILAKGSLERCEEVFHEFRIRWRYGDEYLLSRVSYPHNEIDLTPFRGIDRAREDCNSVHIPRKTL